MKELENPHACSNCQGGMKHRRKATLMTWLGNDLITVPDFPAWVCDICGDRIYDVHAMAELSLLLNPEAGTPIHTGSRPPQKPPLSPPPMA